MQEQLNLNFVLASRFIITSDDSPSSSSSASSSVGRSIPWIRCGEQYLCLIRLPRCYPRRHHFSRSFGSSPSSARLHFISNVRKRTAKAVEHTAPSLLNEIKLIPRCLPAISNRLSECVYLLAVRGNRVPLGSSTPYFRYIFRIDFLSADVGRNNGKKTLAIL